MGSRRHQNRDQLVLQLERQNLQVPGVKNVKGLVEALADLLLLEANRMTKTGGVDEHEDHA
ncbi:hypothetical protein [Rhizobium leguminosarum]|uniref:hypothetical protein n=1 Tax=Rhizobium leguminosarum TaxID=384 RepID=UPI000488B419|nr:hypothetical protein [Rhizobium leguminosarum]